MYIFFRSMQSQEAQKKSEEKEKECTFAPTIFTVPVKEFDGTARRLTDESGKAHIARQAKARKEKVEQQSKVMWKGLRKSSGGGLPTSTAAGAPNSKNSVISISRETLGMTQTKGADGEGSGGSSREDLQGEMERAHAPTQGHNSHPGYGLGVLGGANNLESGLHPHDSPLSNLMRTSLEGDDADLHSMQDDISVVEILERERRQWHAERIKLIHCIHLQQLELAARSSAAQERATDIAKEFARAIDGFEQRLVAMETNSQKELQAIRSVVEAMRGANTVHTPPPPPGR